ncbi:MAG: cupredoxin domain-containing protein [Ilumatobacteraceae bacterium]
MRPIGLRSLGASAAICSLLLVTACGGDDESSTSTDATSEQSPAADTTAPATESSPPMSAATTMTTMGGTEPADTEPAGTEPAGTEPAGTEPQGAADEVTIADFAFDPAELEVAAGATVTWTNNDSATHTVESDDETLMSDDLPSGATYEMTFDEPGTYEYVCGIHPNMAGTVIVK